MVKVTQKKWYLFLAVIIVLLIGGVMTYTLSNNSSSPLAVSSPAQPNKPQQVSQSPGGQPITIAGVVECLTPSNTTGPQATSCAIGLKGDDGKSYAITSDDPTTTGSLPTGAHVQVVGSVTQQATQYSIAGIIHVDSIQRL